jgi:uncharacterized protein YecE (DUF72 family)
MTKVQIGTAGWAIPRHVAEAFPTEGSGLQRYAGRFGAVEINSTFYRPHRAGTLARWVETTPADFRFAVKLPRTITHERRLLAADELLATFRAETEPLRPKLGPLLVQLPPSLAFDPPAAEAFFVALRDVWPEAAVCEPRHASWFEAEADALLRSCRIARVAADPARVPEAALPGGWPELAYWRLHGSPRMYYSAYDDEALGRLGESLRQTSAKEVWYIFDNTTSGAAAANALRLQEMLRV